MLESRIKKANKVIRIVLLSLVGLIVLFALVLGGLCLSGYKILWVKGDSAVQSIKPFSLILVKPCDIEDLKVRDPLKGTMGDFAVRITSTGFVTHEVCEKYFDETTQTWYFDTIQAGDRGTQTDGEKFGGDFAQKDLAGKVVAKESVIGKLLAWIQGYPNIDSVLTAGPNKTLAIIRIFSLAVILYGIAKFSDFIRYKESIY